MILNVISSIHEKWGGREYNMNVIFDFTSVIEACGFVGIWNNGQFYTWFNQRGEGTVFWKITNRALVNDIMFEMKPQTTIMQIPSEGSDHCPLLMKMDVRQEQNTKYFKFLSCWTEKSSFLATL